MTVLSEPTYDAVDLSSATFWAKSARNRDEAFAELRRLRPVSFHAPMEGGLVPASKGFWAVVRHAEVVHASRHPELFCSGQGVSFEEIPMEFQEALGSFLVTDAPRHTRLRRLISGAFTPRRVAAIEEQIQRHAYEIVNDAVAHGECELVETLSMRLPLWTISEMIGVPPDRREELYHAANTMVGTNDPDFVPPGADGMPVLLGAAVTLTTIGADLAAERRAHPTDDLMTALVDAEIDGERLTDEEIGSFMVVLGVAGNDTTRNSISHAVHAFGQNPRQWDTLRADPANCLPGAVEEIVRWASPVINFRRTVTEDTELAGRHLRAGDHVVLFYISANRDESVFTDPWTFDITRSPNDHVAFGGGGPHFCLGANLARAQLRAVFGELARRVAGFDVDEPEYLAGNFIHGIKRLPCRFVVDRSDT